MSPAWFRKKDRRKEVILLVVQYLSQRDDAKDAKASNIARFLHT
jgi:hypothetical protein